MAALFSLNQRLTPKPGQTLIKAGEAAVFFEARDLIRAWEERAAQLDQAAEEERERRFQQGYEDGLAAGRLEYTEKIMEAVIQSVEYIEGLETTLVKVVGEAVRRIVGEMDDDERIVRLVRQALGAVRGEKRVLVRVAPRDEKAVRLDLAALLGRNAGSGFLELVPDPRLQPGECLLESELGVVEASLETQLRNLETALLNRVKDGGG